MAGPDERHSEARREGRSAQAAVQPAEGKPAATDHQADGTRPDRIGPPPAGPAPARPRSRRKWVVLGLVVAGVAVGAYFLVPGVLIWLNTVSTDDAYVNSHVTFVAPRVPGLVKKVLVDDNMRVKRGDVLVRLDREPYEVLVQIKKAAVAAADASLTTARAEVRGLEALARSQRWQVQLAMEQVANKTAKLRADVADYESKKATRALARANFKRGEKLEPTGGISKEDLDQRRQALKVAEAAVEQALQNVYADRVALGLPAQPPRGHDLAEVPPKLEQTFSAVRAAVASLVQTMAKIGRPLPSTDATFEQVLTDFKKLNARGDIDVILEELVTKAPGVKQAEANLLQAQSDLDQAKLNLRYCDIVSEIDGVVTRRTVNPGDYVQTGQNLMAVRSLTEIWIDANFKETQLGRLRIGQRVKVEVDMYGRHKEFEGRITGFTMGTGQTLSLLPPENATGNFVKIVQRLPVRVELTDYDPDAGFPLFVGLSCTPFVYVNEPPSGPHAGEYLQPFAPLPRAPTEPRP
jgi:membrane fusion protein (multidrug efflux system)